MMAPRPESMGLIARLPTVRGRYGAGARLDRLTWFRAGGPAEVLFEPADVADLICFLSQKPPEIPITVLGIGSNVLIRDGGVPGVVVRLGRAFAGSIVAGRELRVGAGALCPKVAKAARDAGLAGLEFLTGVPGTIGGALRMNAGAHGGEMSQILVTARALDDHGQIQELEAEAMGFSYRHASVPASWIFVGAALRGRAGERRDIARRMAAVKAEREASQPIRARTGGSTFVNPPGVKAWELIERAGCRGLQRGAAKVSEKHCNFLINTGGATAADLEGLGEEVRRRVLAETGVGLDWEIRRIGRPEVTR